MAYFQFHDNRLKKKESLTEALSIDPQVHTCVSFVGAGGKTTLLFALADELAGLGKRVVVTTTTRIYRPSNREVLTSGREEAPRVRLPGVLVAGMEAEGGKLSGLPAKELQKLSCYADIILVEADGAKRLPLKAPEAWEPALPKESSLTVAVAGLDCIGRPLSEVCFRWERAADRLKMPGDAVIGPGEVARILTALWGGRKNVGSRDFRVVLNKADDGKRLELGTETALRIRDLPGGEAVSCAVTAFDKNERNGENI